MFAYLFEDSFIGIGASISLHLSHMSRETDSSLESDWFYTLWAAILYNPPVFHSTRLLLFRVHTTHATWLFLVMTWRASRFQESLYKSWLYLLIHTSGDDQHAMPVFTFQRLKQPSLQKKKMRKTKERKVHPLQFAVDALREAKNKKSKKLP